MPTNLLATAALKTVPDVSVGHALLQMVLALAVIVGSIVVLTKVLARIRGGAKVSNKRQATGGLSIVSRQSLGKDLSIATVKWNGREVLVGISGSTITFLNDARADEPASDEAPVPAAPASLQGIAGPSTPFSPALLAAAARGGAMPRLVPAPPSARISLLEQLRDATLRH
ncbi:MAG: flagellar biosynthetic protein FliO [Actinomycetota bacterium]|nr:flagellar biosynthetic protein FliO [Actinomycetota bacterium]